MLPRPVPNGMQHAGWARGDMLKASHEGGALSAVQMLRLGSIARRWRGGYCFCPHHCCLMRQRKIDSSGGRLPLRGSSQGNSQSCYSEKPTTNSRLGSSMDPAAVGTLRLMLTSLTSVPEGASTWSGHLLFLRAPSFSQSVSRSSRSPRRSARHHHCECELQSSTSVTIASDAREADTNPPRPLPSESLGV